MTHPRRLLVLSAVCTALAAALPAAAEPGKLTVWYSVEGAKGMSKVAEEFTKKTGVPVVVEAPENATGKFQQAAAAGKGPDIFIWAHDRAGEWIGGGLLEPVSMGKKVRDDTNAVGLKAWTIGGKTWGYPFSVEAVGLIYNKAIVKNPPKSIDEIIALDKQLAPKGQKAILWDYKNTYFTFPFMAAGGGYAFKQKADGSYDPADTGVANAGAIAGGEMLDKLLRAKVMPTGSGYAEMEGAMAQGKLATMISGPWAWENLRKANIDFGVAKLPTIDGHKAVPFVGVKGVMINKASQNKELAVEFIENYLLTPAGLKTVNDAEKIGVPASKAFYEQLKSDPNIAATMESVQDGVPMPNNPEMGRFWSAMEAALSNIMEGRQKPKEALDAAKARILTK